MLKFGNELVKPREFYNFATTFTDIDSVNVDHLTVSYPVPSNGGKDQRYIVGYHTRDFVVNLRVKTPKIWSPHGVSQYNTSAVPPMSLDFKEYPDWIEKYRQIWDKISELISEQLTSL